MMRLRMEGKTKMESRIYYLLTNPKQFFTSLSKEKNHTATIVYFLAFSLIIFLFWFVKIILQINRSPNNLGNQYFATLFYPFDLQAIFYLFIFLLADILIISLFSLVMVLLIKSVLWIFKTSATAVSIFRVSVYALFAFVLQSLFYFAVYLFDIPSLRKWGYVFSTYYVILLIIGTINGRGK